MVSFADVRELTADMRWEDSNKVNGKAMNFSKLLLGRNDLLIVTGS